MSRIRQAAAFRALAERKSQLTGVKRDEMRLDEFKPKVMSSFVRNRLIDDVYLPLIGDNLAKQLGTAGANTRTDRSGLLLLISPPGYGKTTIMEYVANRLDFRPRSAFAAPLISRHLPRAALTPIGFRSTLHGSLPETNPRP